MNDTAGSRATQPYAIVGVVRDSRYMNPRGEIEPLVYVPFSQMPTGRGQMALYVRADGEETTILSRIREEVARVDPTLPLFEIHTLQHEMDAALVQQRLLALLTTLFGGLALLLACIGIYGLLSFSVAQRTAELGIRAALGARRSALQWLVMREALSLVGVGLVVGFPLALAVSQLAAQVPDLLLGLETGDPMTIALAAVCLLAVATLATYIPANRASRIDPMIALRSE